MGNYQQIANSENKDVQIIKYDPILHEIHIKTESTNLYLIGRSITVKARAEQNRIQSLINTKTSFPSPYIEPLQRVQKIRKQSVFQDQTEFVLLFKKPYRTLSDQIRERKLYSTSFSEEQAQIIVENCIQGLEYLRINGSQHGNIDSANITINQSREIRMTDPWMVLRGQQTKLVSAVSHPSPQKYRAIEQTFSTYKNHQSDLFSLGMVILQLFDSSSDQTSQKFDQLFNPIVIGKRISKIQSVKLQNYCQILTSFDPKRRRDIYNQFNKTQVIGKNSINTNVQQLSKLRKSIVGSLYDRQKSNMIQNTNPVHTIIHPSLQIPVKVSNLQSNESNNISIKYGKTNNLPSNLSFKRANNYVGDIHSRVILSNSRPVNSYNGLNSHNNYNRQQFKINQRPNNTHSVNQHIQISFNSQASKAKVKLMDYQRGFNRLQVAGTHHLQTNQNRIQDRVISEPGIRIQNSKIRTSSSWQQTPQFNQFNSEQKKQYFPIPSSFDTKYSIANINKSIQMQNPQYIHSRIVNQAQKIPSYTLDSIKFGYQALKQSQEKKIIKNDDKHENEKQKIKLFQKVSQASSFSLKQQDQTYSNLVVFNSQTVQQPQILDNNMQNMQASKASEYQKLTQSNFDQQKLKSTENNQTKSQQVSKQVMRNMNIHNSIESRSIPDILTIQMKDKIQKNPIMKFPNYDFKEQKQKAAIIESLKSQDQNILVSDQSLENYYKMKYKLPVSIDKGLVNKSQSQYQKQSIDSIPLEKIQQEQYSAIQSNSDLNQQDFDGSEQKILINQFDGNSRNPVCPPSSNLKSSISPKKRDIQNKSQSDDEQYVIQEYEVGSRYEGQKKHGMRNGWGKFYYQQGSLFDGEWKDNKMHGYGKLYYANGQLAYQGDWFQDEFHGQGKVYNDNPAVLQGPFDYNDFNQLEQQWVFYEGGLVSDVKQGLGKIKLQNDQIFMGNFYNDKLNGQGRFYCSNGSVVHGFWKDSLLIEIIQ